MNKLTFKEIHKRALIFHKNYLLDANQGKPKEIELMRLRENFIKKFNLDYIEHDLDVKKYAIGSGDKDTFCYLIERGLLSGLGSARGGYSRKFGVYYSAQHNVFKSDRRYSNDLSIAFGIVKNDLVTIINAAYLDKIELVNSTKFWYIIKFKIYWLYNPFHDIPVFNRNHVKEIIKYYNISCSKGDIEERKALYKFKTTYIAFSKMTNREFMCFLYSSYSGLNLKEDTEIKNESKTFESRFEKPLEEFVGTYTKCVGAYKNKKICKDNRTINVRQTDFLELNKRKQSLGKFGEMLIVNDEATKLKNLGINEIVEHSSVEIGDGIGYDIKSFDKDGREIYIEVKTTKANASDHFHLSKSENNFGSSKRDRYYIYRVYCLDIIKATYKVKIYRFDEVLQLFNFEPQDYLLTLK